MVTGSDIWLLVRLYGDWFGYMVTGSVLWLLDSLYGYWYGCMVTGSVIWLPGLVIWLLAW